MTLLATYTKRVRETWNEVRPYPTRFRIGCFAVFDLAFGIWWVSVSPMRSVSFPYRVITQAGYDIGFHHHPMRPVGILYLLIGASTLLLTMKRKPVGAGISLVMGTLVDIVFAAVVGVESLRAKTPYPVPGNAAFHPGVSMEMIHEGGPIVLFCFTLIAVLRITVGRQLLHPPTRPWE